MIREAYEMADTKPDIENAVVEQSTLDSLPVRGSSIHFSEIWEQ